MEILSVFVCIIIPVVISFWAGYTVSLYRHGWIRVGPGSAQAPATCAACGHQHPGHVCDCGCGAFVEDVHEK